MGQANSTMADEADGTGSAYSSNEHSGDGHGDDNSSLPSLTTGPTASDMDWSSGSESSGACVCEDNCDCAQRAAESAAETAAAPPAAATEAPPPAEPGYIPANLSFEHVRPRYGVFRALYVSTATILCPALAPAPDAVPDRFLNLASLRVFHACEAQRQLRIEALSLAYADQYCGVRQLSAAILSEAHELRRQVAAHFGDAAWGDAHMALIDEMCEQLARDVRRLETLSGRIRDLLGREGHARALWYEEGELHLVNLRTGETSTPAMVEFTREVWVMMELVEREGGRMYAERMWTELDLALD